MMMRIFYFEAWWGMICCSLWLRNPLLGFRLLCVLCEDGCMGIGWVVSAWTFSFMEMCKSVRGLLKGEVVMESICWVGLLVLLFSSTDHIFLLINVRVSKP